MTDDHRRFMLRAIALAKEGMENNDGGPFGAVVVKNGEIIAEGNNQVLSSLDPTAHAEVVAIRKACEYLGDFQLTDCTIYTSCEPCPMCLGAIYWARPAKVFYGCSKEDAALIGFDDHFIYEQINTSKEVRDIPFLQFLSEEAIVPFELWAAKVEKKIY